MMQKKIKSLFIFLLIFAPHHYCHANYLVEKGIEAVFGIAEGAVDLSNHVTKDGKTQKIIGTENANYTDDIKSTEDITEEDPENADTVNDNAKFTTPDISTEDIKKEGPENIVNIVLDVERCIEDDNQKAYQYYVNNIEKAVARSINVIQDVMAGDVKEQKKIIKDITKKMQHHMLKIVKETMFKECTKIYNNPKSKDGTYKINKLLKTFALDDDKIIRSPDFENIILFCAVCILKRPMMPK